MLFDVVIFFVVKLGGHTLIPVTFWYCSTTMNLPASLPVVRGYYSQSCMSFLFGCMKQYSSPLTSVLLDQYSSVAVSRRFASFHLDQPGPKSAVPSKRTAGNTEMKCVLFRFCTSE